MPVSAMICWRQNARLRHALVAGALLVLWIGCDVLLHLVVDSAGDRQLVTEVNRVHRLTSYLQPLFAGTILVLMVRLGWQGRTSIDPRAAAAGCAFILGAAGSICARRSPTAPPSTKRATSL